MLTRNTPKARAWWAQDRSARVLPCSNSPPFVALTHLTIRSVKETHLLERVLDTDSDPSLRRSLVVIQERRAAPERRFWQET